MKRFADVKFVTASRARELYRDVARNHEFTPAELDTLAGKVADRAEVNFRYIGESVLAPSETLYLLDAYFLGMFADAAPAAYHLPETPFGPTSSPQPMPNAITTDKSQFVRTAKDVASFIQKQGRVPGTIWLGSVGVTPEAFLKALAKVLVGVKSGHGVPDQIELTPAKLETAKYVAADDPKLWGWVVFPPAFKSAPAMMDLARRQAWTLKPAILYREPK
jgi:hypothetical protein